MKLFNYALLLMIVFAQVHASERAGGGNLPFSVSGMGAEHLPRASSTGRLPPIFVQIGGGGGRPASFWERIREGATEQVIINVAVSVAVMVAGHYVKQWLTSGATEDALTKAALENQQAQLAMVKEFRHLAGEYFACRNKFERGVCSLDEFQAAEDAFIAMGGHEAYEVIQKYRQPTKQQSPLFDVSSEFMAPVKPVAARA